MAGQWTYYNLVVYFISYIVMPVGGNQLAQTGGKGGMWLRQPLSAATQTRPFPFMMGIG